MNWTKNLHPEVFQSNWIYVFVLRKALNWVIFVVKCIKLETTFNFSSLRKLYFLVLTPCSNCLVSNRIGFEKCWTKVFCKICLWNLMNLLWLKRGRLSAIHSPVSPSKVFCDTNGRTFSNSTHPVFDYDVLA